MVPVGLALPLMLISTPAALAQDWGAVSPLGWLAIIYMVILPVYVAYMIWNWAIARRGVAAATSFSLLVPIASGTLSAWLFGEQFALTVDGIAIIAAWLVLVGYLLARVRRSRAGAREDEVATA